MQGEIEFLIPRGSNAFIEAKSMRGGIDCQLQLKRLKRSGFRLSGTLGEGGAKVELKSMSGRITIAESGESNHLAPEEELIAKMVKEGRITKRLGNSTISETVIRGFGGKDMLSPKG